MLAHADALDPDRRESSCAECGASPATEVGGKAGPDLAGGRPGAKLVWGVTRWETVKALGLKLHD